MQNVTPSLGRRHRRPRSLEASVNVLRQEGEYWRAHYAGTQVRLKDSKGLHYVAYLLRHPGRQFHACELMAVAPGPDGERAQFDMQYPKAAVAERARLAVTKRIKALVMKLETCHPALAYYLRTTIKTGYYCTYLPDPHRPVSWELKAQPSRAGVLGY